MTSAICTLFEGHYHYGVGALANSLYAHGFRGTIYVGYRGPLPPWVPSPTSETDSPLEVPSSPLPVAPVVRGPSSVVKVGDSGECVTDFSPAPGLTLRFIPLTTKLHFTNYKPTFMKQVWDQHCPQAGALFYFDPDIVIRCRWSFFEEWAACGVALCQEITNSNLPSNHPFRFRWKAYAEGYGLVVKKQLNQLFSGGYIGVGAKWRSCLDVWETLIQGLPSRGIPLDRFMASDPTSPFNASDQMALNVMAMVADVPLSTVGPEEMDFIPGGSYMSHATCSPKPWRKQFTLSALKGISPSRAEKAFWQRTQFPIRLFSKPALSIKKIDLKFAAALSRFMRRN